MGLWYFDPYARPGKQSGAWMNAYRDQERFEDEVTTIVSNNANFVKGKPGEPVLISWDDAQTLFHEFGHALHGLTSNVTYPSLAGTRWRATTSSSPRSCSSTGCRRPRCSTASRCTSDRQADAARAGREDREGRDVQPGLRTVEYLASALVDMKLHLAGAADDRPGRVRDARR